MKFQKILKLLTASAISITMLLGTCNPIIVSATETVSDTEQTEFKIGTRDGSNYYNEVLNLKCEADPDIWYMATDEEMMTIYGLTEELFSDEEVNEMLKEGNAIMDLYLQNLNTGATLNIMVEPVDNILSRVATTVLNDVQYRDAQYEAFISEQYDEVIYESLGLTDGSVEKGTVPFMGDDEYPCLVISGTMDASALGVDGGIPLYEKILFVRSHGYVATITNATFLEDTTDEGIALFSHIE